MNQKPLKVLGVDPGTRITGYGILEGHLGRFQVLDYGCIRPPANDILSMRYRIIYEGICELLDKFQPDAVAVESQYMRDNFSSVLKLGMAKGMVLLAASQRSIPIHEYAPSKAKSAVVGNGRASKIQVQTMVQKLLSLSQMPQPTDAADALALAICHIHNANRPVSCSQPL